MPSRVISFTWFHLDIWHSLVSSGSIHALYGPSPIVLFKRNDPDSCRSCSTWALKPANQSQLGGVVA